MKYYTKKGDKGNTLLIDGKRYPKHHIKVEALGTIDELMCHIGLVRDHLDDEKEGQDMLTIQLWLAACIAYLLGDEKAMKKASITEESVYFLEKQMDKMDQILPKIKSFIIPGGHSAVSVCHIARTVCRRAERRVSELHEAEEINDLVLKFLNRLSDYLFAMARKMAFDKNINEIYSKDYL